MKRGKLYKLDNPFKDPLAYHLSQPVKDYKQSSLKIFEHNFDLNWINSKPKFKFAQALIKMQEEKIANQCENRVLTDSIIQEEMMKMQSPEKELTDFIQENQQVDFGSLSLIRSLEKHGTFYQEQNFSCSLSSIRPDVSVQEDTMLPKIRYFEQLVVDQNNMRLVEEQETEQNRNCQKHVPSKKIKERKARNTLNKKPRCIENAYDLNKTFCETTILEKDKIMRYMNAEKDFLAQFQMKFTINKPHEVGVGFKLLLDGEQTALFTLKRGYTIV